MTLQCTINNRFPTYRPIAYSEGGPHFTETELIMAKDRTKQSIRNVPPGDSGETSSEGIKWPQFLSAVEGYTSLQTGGMRLSPSQTSKSESEVL